METSKYFKTNLRLLRHLNNYSQEKLAKDLGYKSFTTVQKWEDGTSYPKFENIIKLSSIFNVSINNFLLTDISKSIAKKKAIPILGHVQAGSGILAQENYLGYEYVDVNDNIGEYFYLKVTGDSMIDVRINDGDILYVKKQSFVDSNDIAIVLLENDEATVKRVIYDAKGMCLKPENSNYPTRFFSFDEIEEKNIQIIGKVIHNKIMF